MWRTDVATVTDDRIFDRRTRGSQGVGARTHPSIVEWREYAIPWLHGQGYRSPVSTDYSCLAEALGRRTS